MFRFLLYLLLQKGLPSKLHKHKKEFERPRYFENDNTFNEEFQDDVKEDDLSILDTDKAAKKETEYKKEREEEYGFHRKVGADHAVAKNDNENATTNASTSDIDSFYVLSNREKMRHLNEIEKRQINTKKPLY